MANRHGLITGASGSGKTISLKVMAESFSSAGVPVFMVDVKGDLAATCKVGEMNDNVKGRVEKLGLTLEIEGQVCQVIEFQHVKPGKGAAFVRVKMKNVITGAVIERTFCPSITAFPWKRLGNQGAELM